MYVHCHSWSMRLDDILCGSVVVLNSSTQAIVLSAHSHIVLTFQTFSKGSWEIESELWGLGCNKKLSDIQYKGSSKIRLSYIVAKFGLLSTGTPTWRPKHYANTKAYSTSLHCWKAVIWSIKTMITHFHLRLGGSARKGWLFWLLLFHFLGSLNPGIWGVQDCQRFKM